MGAGALLVLLWTCRRAPLGVPAADDYDYLYALRFQPFDFFGPLGSLSYWRPLGRQLYYAALGPAFFTAPWIVTAVHACLLFALFVLLFRIGRRVFPASVAAAAATFPLLAEPMRTLFVWPTGGEYLMAMLASALAVHEALSRRWWTASIAALAALLCHEASVLVLPAVLFIAWRRRSLRGGALGMGAVAALWLTGRVIARGHGAGWLDRGAAGGSPFLKWLEAVFRVLMSQLNLEELGSAHVLVAAGYALIAIVAAVLFVRAHRPRPKSATPAILGAAVWLGLGALPLAFLAQWNSWRSPFPALWLGVVVIGFPGLARPWLAYAALGLRTLALILAPTAATLVTLEPPPSASGMSYVRVARLQRTAERTRAALLGHDPTLPPGATIAYWSRLAVTEIALVPPKAPRVWYGDSTITWRWLWRPGGLDARNDVVLSFDPNVSQPAVVLEPHTLDLARDAVHATERGQARAADSLLAAAAQTQSAHPSGQLALWVVRNRARVAYQAGAFEQAERMNQASFEMIGPSAEYFGMAALIELRKGQLVQARELMHKGLALEAGNPLALRAQAEMGDSAR